jgi:lipopolysaccharide/colanic/teichoic acid biosynthesis glycosyltransferase
MNLTEPRTLRFPARPLEPAPVPERESAEEPAVSVLAFPVKEAQPRLHEIRSAEPFWHEGYVGKRSFDVVFGSLLLLVSLPILIIAAVVTRLRHGRSALVWRKFVGLGGREFLAPQLRVAQDDQNERVRQGVDAVPFPRRKVVEPSRLGRWLQATGIARLPLLWSVLRGDMSLVGPRAYTPDEVAKFGSDDMARLAVTPGFTGLGQVSGTPQCCMQELEYFNEEYRRRQGPILDMAILSRAFVQALVRRPQP